MAGEPSSTHDVFFLDLSEWGTTKGYSGGLLKALDDLEIRTFTFEDVELLPPGEDEIPQAIQESKIAIVGLIGGYRDVSLRRWEVLVHILDHFKRNPQRIIQVYYVDRRFAHKDLFRSDDNFENRNKYREKTGKDVDKLSKVMDQVDDLPGWDFNWYNYDTIVKFNRIIASQVSKMLNPAPLYVPVYPVVGLESRLEEVWRLLSLTSSNREFLNIGFYGRQGIGKSTLARAVYNSIAHLFEVSCFLHNIRENSNTRGLVGVQKMLLSQISGETDIRLQNVGKGVSMIKDRLRQKDVLLILDDVDSLDQLEALGRGPGWGFSSGSRVIITTRDEHLLTYHGNDMLLYDVQELNHKDALELLSRRAFEHGNVDPRYTEVLNRAIRYASGLPLVLDMIGSFWYGRSVDECEKALDRLERIPYNDIQSIQGALTTSRSDTEASHISPSVLEETPLNDTEASHISLSVPEETPLNDTESSQTESIAGVTSQMDFQKRMLILVFVATNIAGLSCNFSSPHFKSSIRVWTVVKFFPFMLFVLGVVAVIKYIYWPQTISGLIKCCICFVIFLFISVYSHFYDRAMDGKPGIRSLFSNAMFALASLSLSKLFGAGFETGIFNYFLQCFMIQMLTIHWWLIFVAIIIAVPLFDWHFSVEIFLLTRVTKWFGTIRRWFGTNPLRNRND